MFIHFTFPEHPLRAVQGGRAAWDGSLSFKWKGRSVTDHPIQGEVLWLETRIPGRHWLPRKQLRVSGGSPGVGGVGRGELPGVSGSELDLEGQGENCCVLVPFIPRGVGPLLSLTPPPPLPASSPTHLAVEGFRSAGPLSQLTLFASEKLKSASQRC